MANDPDSDRAAAESTEQRFAANLRMVREEKGLSQGRLAAEMTVRGWPWRQQTVTRMEAGQRMVRLGEATDIAEILGVTVERLTWPSAEEGQADMIGRAMVRMRTSWRDVGEAVTRLLGARAAALRLLAVSRGSRYRHVREVCDELEASLAVLTVEKAVGEGAASYSRHSGEDSQAEALASVPAAGRQEKAPAHNPAMAAAATELLRQLTVPLVPPEFAASVLALCEGDDLDAIARSAAALMSPEAQRAANLIASTLPVPSRREELGAALAAAMGLKAPERERA